VPRNERASEEEKYRHFLELSRRISRTFDLDEILGHLLLSVRAAIPYDAAGVFVLSRSVPLASGPSPGLISGMATIGFDRPRSADDPMLRSGRGIVGHVIRTGERVVAPDVGLDDRYVAGRAPTRSEVAVPIVFNGQVVGALNLESDRLASFGARDADLLEFFASAAALAIERALLHREVVEKQRMQHQLELARLVQAGLLPATPPRVAGYDLAGLNHPTWEIGGDYYDFLPLPDGRLGLVVADVSGKGVPAALIMAGFRAAIRSVLHPEGDLPKAIAAVNHVVFESVEPSRFVTAVCGILDPASGAFSYVNCGHNPPLLLGSRQGVGRLPPGGLPLGILHDARFESGAVTLAPGASLVLYTDGVVEATDPSGEQFGADRLVLALRSSEGASALDMVHAAIAATRAFAGREDFDDDVTVVIVRREGAS
jgi:phosphoserine phosphatase RsbU/P